MVRALKDATVASSSNTILKYGTDGALVDENVMCKQAGLEPGIVCKRKDLTAFAVIKALGGKDGLHMESTDGARIYNIQYPVFLKEWEILYDKAAMKDLGILLNYREYSANSNESVELARAWGKVQFGLQHAQNWIDKIAPLPLLKMLTKPDKDKKAFLNSDAKAPPSKSTRD